MVTWHFVVRVCLNVMISPPMDERKMSRMRESSSTLKKECEKIRLTTLKILIDTCTLFPFNMGDN